MIGCAFKKLNKHCVDTFPYLCTINGSNHSWCFFFLFAVRWSDKSDKHCHKSNTDRIVIGYTTLMIAWVLPCIELNCITLLLLSHVNFLKYFLNTVSSGEPVNDDYWFEIKLLQPFSCYAVVVTYRYIYLHAYRYFSYHLQLDSNLLKIYLKGGLKQFVRGILGKAHNE